MNLETPDKLILPALRGVMGRWVYYSCLMTLKDLGERVHYAEEVHANKELSKLIQRQLAGKRGKQIAEYLETQPDRFFNSLVVATYGGEPNWYGISNVKTNDQTLGEIDEVTVESVGFLTLNGDEKLFALDGQHRLAGIKKALRDGGDELEDSVSVLFVAHDNSIDGLQRTRRLFTVLNKTAKPVSKGDIITLDEDDVAAICVRRLIETTELFGGDRIAYVDKNNMPASNVTALTTIGNLYDVLTLLFTKAKTGFKAKNKAEIQGNRPTDDILDKYFEGAKMYFKLLGDNFSELGEFFAAKDTSPIVKRYRGSHGGSALFRPIGLDIFTQIISSLTASMSLEDAVALAAKLPRTLAQAPYEGLLWDSSTRTMKTGHNVTVRDILLYMVNGTKRDDADLIEAYRRAKGNSEAALPPKII